MVRMSLRIIGGVDIILSGAGVAFPDLIAGHRWIGFVAMAIGVVVVLATVFVDLEFKWPLKLQLKLRKPWRIPLLELMAKAKNKGWDFFSATALDLLDFADGIRQAGLDGQIKMWGRPVDRLGLFSGDEPLHQIPTDHWKTFELDPISCIRYSTSGAGAGFAFNNVSVRTNRHGSDAPGGTYEDIQVDRRQAMKWLRREASTFKGKHEKRDGNWQAH